MAVVVTRWEWTCGRAELSGAKTVLIARALRVTCLPLLTALDAVITLRQPPAPKVTRA
jgi:hypothetical protein